MPYNLKRILVGRPLETHKLAHQRLNNFMALAVFSSDALSSVAYATEEILIALVVAGAVGLSFSIPVGIAIAALFIIVTLSYRQTIMAYPGGGGSYIVAKDNLGVFPGLIAAAALLTDYILTVAVSTSAGVAAITSAFQSLYPYRVEICVICVAFVTIANLRGVRESGRIFSLPTYFFILSIIIMIIAGLYKVVILHETLPRHIYPAVVATSPVTIFLLLRAFSSGCAALTGIEAISNGIPAFKPPEPVNARTTITRMAALCVFMFGGITFLAYKLQILPQETVTVISQLAESIFGRGFFYYCIQVSTALILIMAVNTSFADFPRLSAILGRANFLPRQMSNLGDRLVFANGIILLGCISAVLLIIFGGTTTRLIPLYAVGVFLSFTLSQTGMVVHWLRLRGPGWRYSIVFNTFGAIATAIVTVVAVTTKFVHGAYIVAILIPCLVYMFYSTYLHYQNVARTLKVADGIRDFTPLKTRVFMPISGITSVSLHALRFCFAISKNVTGIYINVNKEDTDKIQRQIEKMNLPIPIKILESPFRSIIRPIIEFIEEESKEHPDEIITLVIPEFMPAQKWHYFLHNQTAILIYAALRGRENVVITSVRKRLPK